MIFRVTHANPAMRMPPRVTNKSLSPEQIETLRRWIAQGAQYKPHWAFIAPRKARAAAGCGPAVNDIDRFIRRGSSARGCRRTRSGQGNAHQPRHADADGAAADAGRGRRVPEGHQPQRLREGGRSAARVAGIRRAHGRAVARHRRYAESDGFLDDYHDRLLWPYRDWVIAALQPQHAVRPVRHLAARRRSAAQRDEGEQKLATAFLRVGKRTTENGAIDEEYRVEYAVDRRTRSAPDSSAMTVGCARCHDHKYDPISHEGLLLADRVLQQHRRARASTRRAGRHHRGSDAAMDRRGDGREDRGRAGVGSARRRPLTSGRARRRRATRRQEPTRW